MYNLSILDITDQELELFTDEVQNMAKDIEQLVTPELFGLNQNQNEPGSPTEAERE